MSQQQLFEEQPSQKNKTQAGTQQNHQQKPGNAQTTPQQRKTRRISRRVMIAGLTGAGLLTSGATLIWREFFHYNPHLEYPLTTQQPGPWQLKGEALIKTIQGHFPSILWPPDNARVILHSGNKGGLQAWDAHSGKLLYTIKERLDEVALSPDGTMLLAMKGGYPLNGDPESLENLGQPPSGWSVWDARTGEHLAAHETGFDVIRMAWLPDSRHIGVAGRSDTNTYIISWDARTGNNRQVHYQKSTKDSAGYGYCSELRWLSDGKYIAAALSGNWYEDQALYIWDVTSQKMVKTHGDGNWDKRISPDSQYFTRLSDERNHSGTLSIHELLTGKQISSYTFPTGDPLRPFWSPTSKTLAAIITERNSAKNTIEVWDAMSGQLQSQYLGHNTQTGSGGGSVPDLTWSPDGQLIASQNYSVPHIHIWEAATGKLVQIYKGHEESGERTISLLNWSADSKRIASVGIADRGSGDGKGSIQVWEVEGM